MRLDVGFGGWDESQAEEVVDHAHLEHLVRRGGALEQALEVLVCEKLAGADGIKVAVEHAVDVGHCVHAQLGDSVQQVSHGKRVGCHQAG